MTKFIRNFSDNESIESDMSDGSDDSDFERAHSVKHIRNQDTQHDKIVITVVDTGIGIKKKDRKKLFKLFGCLQNTR